MLDEATWDAIGRGLSRIASATEGIAVLVFTYDDSVDETKWPDAPGGVGEPVARVHRRPYHLAAYASRSLAERVEGCLVELGWVSGVRTS